MNAEAPMTEEQGAPMKQIIGGLLPSSAAGLAKASPGIGVGGLCLAGIDIADWVSVLTCIYILIMAVGALPKFFDTFCYFRKKWTDKFSGAGPLVVNVIRDNSMIAAKVDGARGKDDEKSGSSCS